MDAYNSHYTMQILGRGVHIYGPIVVNLFTMQEKDNVIALSWSTDHKMAKDHFKSKSLPICLMFVCDQLQIKLH